MIPQTHIRENFEEHGYVVLPNLANLDLLNEIGREMVRICRGQYEESGIRAFPEAMPDEEVLRHFLCIHHPHKVSSRLIQLMRFEVFASLLAEIIGPNVKCMESLFFVKPPGFQGDPWHQDEGAIPTRDRSMATVWLALDDATEKTGCLRVIPGSHRSGYIYPERANRAPDLYDFPLEAYGFDPDQEVILEAERGTAVIFHGHLLHRSLPNRSPDQFRRALAFHCMNAYSQLPWKGHKDYRDVFMITGEDPYRWKGYEELSKLGLRPCSHLRDRGAMDIGPYIEV